MMSLSLNAVIIMTSNYVLSPLFGSDLVKQYINARSDPVLVAGAAAGGGRGAGEPGRRGRAHPAGARRRRHARRALGTLTHTPQAKPPDQVGRDCCFLDPFLKV